MINNIKVEICDVKSNVNGVRTYTPVDVTEFCNVPLTVSMSLDETLDICMLELDLEQEQPLEPFTRVVIRLEETSSAENIDLSDYDTFSENDNVFYYTKDFKGYKAIKEFISDTEIKTQYVIYRVIENDIVIQTVFGSEPKYKHTLSLIETTKILERIDCDNLTTTNTIVSGNLEFQGNPVAYKRVGSNIWGDYKPPWPTQITNKFIRINGYVDNNRFSTPVLQTREIDLNVKLDVDGMITIFIDGNSYNQVDAKLNYEFTLITKPDATVEIKEGVLPTDYELDQQGIYIINQIYSVKESDNVRYNYELTVSWEINTLEKGVSVLDKNTLYSVTSRLFNTTPLRREGLENTRYYLDDKLEERFKNTDSPEFVFTMGHMMDNLSQIGGFTHAIPKLLSNPFIDTVDGNKVLNDWQDWNKVSFEFLGETEAFRQVLESNKESSWSADDYCSNLVSHVENAVQTNFNTYSSTIEPFVDGFISPRTEDTSFIITDDNVVIKTSKPIYRVVKLEFFSGTGSRDITDNVFEYAKYLTLSGYSETISKANTIFYKKGSNIIDGLTYTPDSAFVIGDLFSKSTIRNITGATGSLKDMQFRITYIPYVNFKVRQYKQVVKDSEHNTLYYNQQANVVDVGAYGENMKGTLLKTGNPIYYATFYYESFQDIPKIGEVTANNYYVSNINTEIYNSMYKSTVQFTKDFNKLNEYIALKSDYRQYEIAETDSLKRSLDYSEFCIVSHETIMNGSNLSKIGITDSLMQAMRNKLNGGSHGSKLSYAWVRTHGTDFDSLGQQVEVVNTFVLPVTAFGFGNSIVATFQMMDNYAATTTVVDMAGAKALEDFVSYTDSYGKVSKMEVILGTDKPKKNTNPKELGKFTGKPLEQTRMVDFSENSFLVDKDSREALAFTYQLQFVTKEESIVLGKPLTEIWGMVGNNKTTLKLVEFKKMPSKLNNESLNLSMFTELDFDTSPYFYSQTKTIRLLSPEKTAGHVGWGILTNDNKLVLATPHYETLNMYFRHNI